MGHRLTRIATRTGDDGSTGLGDNSRVRKDDPRIGAIGDVDELNSALGVLIAEPLPGEVADLLSDVQHRLFDLGAELSMPGRSFLSVEAVSALDQALTRYNADLPALEEFILPGGTRAAALAHVARTVARRAERGVVALSLTGAANDAPRQYLNRLSDLLFVLARVLNRSSDPGAETGDVYWRSAKMARSAGEA